tara:strand:+ start:607 stop:858 length:252 start_codon:yes stop_codon:yes gene_type:complete
MKLKDAHAQRVDQICDNAWNEIPNYSRDEVLKLRKEMLAGNELSRELFHVIWTRHVEPKLDAFYKSDEGRALRKGSLELMEEK